MYSIFFYIITLFGVMSGIFLFPLPSYAADTDIVITEIAAYEKSDHEWIEIYNKGSAQVDITGWKFLEDNINHTLSSFRGDFVIDPGEYAVIADVATNTAIDYSSFTGTLIDSSWQTLNEGGEVIALKSASGAIIEQFTYIAAPNHSLERKNPAAADYSTANWQEHASANSIGAAFSQTTQPFSSSPSTPSEISQQSPTDSSSQSSSAASSSQNLTPAPVQSSWKAARGDVAINEFVADPTDNEKEWVELYNNSNQTIDVGEWTIEDGSKNKIVLKGVLASSGPARFIVFESKDSILNNSGDAIILKDSKGVVIDQVAYGDWDDGMVSNNAPRAQDPASVARFPDGYMSFSDVADFKITRKPTKRESNILIEETSQQEKDTPLASSIVINELLANPSLNATSSDEFIELYNSGKESADLTGWRLETGSGASFTFSSSNASSTIVQPQAYATISRVQSNLPMKNQGGDTVRLFQKGKERATMSVSYRGDAPLDQSYARNSEGDYVWTEISTPGKQNSIRHSNQPPEIIMFIPKTGQAGEMITFDATDSRDEDQDALLFFWDFGDGTKGHGSLTTHLYREAGTYYVELVLKAGTHETTERRKITIKEPTPQAAIQLKPLVNSSSTTLQDQSSRPSIILTEVFPNPAGRDSDEFIELYNEGSVSADLSGWTIEFQGGKNKNSLPSVLLQPKEYLAVSQESGFRQLRNTSEELLLLNASGLVVDSIDYEDAPSGYSLARTESGDWAWTKSPTKGKQNLVHIAFSDEEIQQNESLSPSKRIKPKKVQTSQKLQTASINDISNLKTRAFVRLRGKVTVLPGIFDSTSFYIGSKDQGILIKSSKGIFPLLTMGQEIEVRGKLSKPSSGSAIKIVNMSDITILSTQLSTPSPTAISLSAISDSHVGALLDISGEIKTVRWPNIYIKEGDKDLRIYIKKNTGIPKLSLVVGQKIRVVGILQKTASDYRILPREEKDITITSSPRSTAQEIKKEVYAVPVSGPNIREYFTVTLVAAIVVFGGLMLRSYRRKKIYSNEKKEINNTSLL